MAFNAGAIVGKAFVDEKGWNSGIKSMVKGVGVLAGAVGTLAVGAMVKATKSANEWQKSLSNVTTLTDGAVVSNQEMAKTLLQMDPQLGKTKELTDAMYQAFSAGADTLDEAVQTTETSAKFARAALTDTATAVDVLTTASNAYGKETVSTTHASDVFFTTIKEGKTTGEELASTIGQSIPLFASLNIPIEELGSGLAAMTKQGVNSANATTQLNAIVNSFLKPSEAMTEALKEQGIASGSALLESEGLSGALEFLESASGGSKEALSELLPNTRALRGALALTGEGGKEFANILGEMENAGGATDEAFAKQELTWDTLFNSLDKIQLVAGNVGKFFADDIAQGATVAAQGVLTFLTSSSGMEIVSNLIGGTAATFDLLKSILDPIVDTLGGIFFTTVEQAKELLSLFQTETGKSTLAFDILGFATAKVTAVFKVMGVGIEGAIDNLINLIDAIKQTGGTIGTFFNFLRGDATWDDVKSQASATGDAFKELGKGIVDNWGEMGQTIVDEITGFTTDAKENSEAMEVSFTTTFDNVTTNVKENWGEMITGQEAFVGEMINNNLAMTEAITDQNQELEQETERTTNTIWGHFKQLFDDAELGWKGLYDSFLSVSTFTLDSISTLSDLFYQNELDKITLQNQKELDLLQDKLDSGLISQEQFEEQKALLDQQALDETNKIAEKQFQNQQALQIASVWIDAARSIAGWWGTAPALGPIAGPIFAGVMTAATLGMAGAQTAFISQQQFIPARQFGGLASGLTRINESGSEIVMLPDGSQVIPNDISRQIAMNVPAREGNIIHVSFAGAKISNDMDLKRVTREVIKMLGKEMKRVS